MRAARAVAIESQMREEGAGIKLGGRGLVRGVPARMHTAACLARQPAHACSPCTAARLRCPTHVAQLREHRPFGGGDMGTHMRTPRRRSMVKLLPRCVPGKWRVQQLQGRREQRGSYNGTAGRTNHARSHVEAQCHSSA